MTRPIHPDTHVGHVHLKVADLERSIAFYCGILGFQIRQRYGHRAVFLAAGDYHHHIGLNTWESATGTPPPKGHTGLFHAAFVYPDRPQLADALGRLRDAGIALDGAADHGVSQALYLRDPDDNGLELYWDRPQADWPMDEAGFLAMVNQPLDLKQLLSERP